MQPDKYDTMSLGELREELRTLERHETETRNRINAIAKVVAHREDEEIQALIKGMNRDQRYRLAKALYDKGTKVVEVEAK